MALTPEERARIEKEELYQAEVEQHRAHVRHRIRKEPPKRRTGLALTAAGVVFVVEMALLSKFHLTSPGGLVAFVIALVAAVWVGRWFL